MINVSPHQVLLALTGGGLVLLEVRAGVLTAVSETTMPHEVSCLTVNPLAGDDASAAASTSALVAGVGLWTDNSVRLVALVRLQLSFHLPESCPEAFACVFLHAFAVCEQSRRS
jgi:hypothetical protein